MAEELEVTRHQDAIINMVVELNEIKEKCLAHVVKELLGKRICKSTVKRITQFKVDGRLRYEQYVWDWGKDSEIFLLEWEFSLDESVQPIIEVTSPVDVRDCLKSLKK